jgi:hypothetical protein
MRVLQSQMNQAREMSITQRRYIRITFDASTSEMSLVREDTNTTTTTLSTIPLEGGVKIALVPGVPDTPDAFGNTAPASFTSATGTVLSATGTNAVVKFTPAGTLVDAAGRPANGSVFLAIPESVRSVRAVTVLGTTGRVRSYAWTGTAWKGEQG